MYNIILRFVMFCNKQTFCEVKRLCVKSLQRLLLLNLWHDAVCPLQVSNAVVKTLDADVWSGVGESYPRHQGTTHYVRPLSSWLCCGRMRMLHGSRFCLWHGHGRSRNTCCYTWLQCRLRPMQRYVCTSVAHADPMTSHLT